MSISFYVKVVEDPYTMREARIHLRHVRDLLKSLDPSDAYNGLDCSSLSYLNVITQGDILGNQNQLYLLFLSEFVALIFNDIAFHASLILQKFKCKVYLFALK